MNEDFIAIAMSEFGMGFSDLMMLTEACASCGIEGNKTGEEYCKLFNKNGKLNANEKKKVKEILGKFVEKK